MIISSTIYISHIPKLITKMSNQGGSLGLIAILSFVLIIQNYFIVADSSRIKSPFFGNFMSGNHKSVGNSHDEGTTNGTKWAVLVAGSNGWWNYRHQVRISSIYTYIIIIIII